MYKKFLLYFIFFISFFNMYFVSDILSEEYPIISKEMIVRDHYTGKVNIILKKVLFLKANGLLI